jgi:hypothetical protein
MARRAHGQHEKDSASGVMEIPARAVKDLRRELKSVNKCIPVHTGNPTQNGRIKAAERDGMRKARTTCARISYSEPARRSPARRIRSMRYSRRSSSCVPAFCGLLAAFFRSAQSTVVGGCSRSGGCCAPVRGGRAGRRDGHRQTRAQAVFPPKYYHDFKRPKAILVLTFSITILVLTFSITFSKCPKPFKSSKSLSFRWIMGSLAGAIGAVAHDSVLTPMDVVKQRMQLGGSRSCMQCARTVMKKEGVFALYRSFPVTLLTNIPNSAVLVSCNET